MKQYIQLLRDIMLLGNDRGSRAGGTRSVFGYQMRFNLQEGFPLLTTKKMHTKAIVHELLWFLRGDTNIKYLLENDVHIWSADAYRMYMRDKKKGDTFSDIQNFEKLILSDDLFAKRWGDLGPVYGAQWRKWKGEATEIDTHKRGPNNPGPGFTVTDYTIVDQIKGVIESIRSNPEGRRHIVTAWNPAEVDGMALPPCHCLFQFYVHDGRLSCHLYQRSADTFLGVPFNIASYALLTHIIAHQCGLAVGEFIHSFGDVHIYNNHFDAVSEQLGREPLPLCKLTILGLEIPQIDEYTASDFVFEDYTSHPAIKAELSVGT